MIEDTISGVDPMTWVTVANVGRPDWVEVRAYSDGEFDPGRLELGVRLVLEGFDEAIGASVGDGPLQEIRLKPHYMALVDIMASDVDTHEEVVVKSVMEAVPEELLVQVSHQFSSPIDIRVEIDSY